MRTKPPQATAATSAGCIIFYGIVIGTGIGSVYCIMAGAMSNHTYPTERATAIGVYKFWRDLGVCGGWPTDGGCRGSCAHHTGGGRSSVDREFEYSHLPRGGIGRSPNCVHPHLLSGREELKHDDTSSPSYETKN